MKYSCCIELLFTEYEFVERIYKAKEAGFDCIEFWCWQDKDIDGIKNALNETGMELAIMQGNIEGRMVDANDFYIYMEGVRESVKISAISGRQRIYSLCRIL